MGVLPWIMSMLLLFSCLSWFQRDMLTDSFFLVQTIISSSESNFQRDFEIPISEKSQLLYAAVAKRSQEDAVSDFSNQIIFSTPGTTKKPSSIISKLQRQEEIIPDEKFLPKEKDVNTFQLLPQQPQLKLTRRLHINELFASQEGGPRKEVEKKIMLRFMTYAYTHLLQYASLFSHASNAPSLLYENFLDSLLAEIHLLKDKMTIKEPERLANLELSDTHLSYLFFRILKGGQVGSQAQQNQFPSLLTMISTKKRATLLSVYLAPKSLIYAICDNEHDVEQLLQERRAIYKKMCDASFKKLSNDDRTLFQEEFRNRVTSLISKDIDQQWIDFSVSKTAP